MRYIIFIVGLIALTNLKTIVEGKAITERNRIEKRQAKNPPKCN